jgi:TetR/AcrR family transcriptional repressor of lmrAB and yxaGH operons
MGSKGSGTRDRMLQAMAEALESRGYAATGLNDIVGQAQAPKGSIYHHFPGGKEQLASAALRISGAVLAEQLGQALDAARGAAPGIQRIFAEMERRMTASNFTKGCPLMTTALETAGTCGEVNSTCRQVFQDWVSIFAKFLMRCGYTERSALQLGESILSLLEGAIVLSRTNHSAEPIRRAARTARLILSKPEES